MNNQNNQIVPCARDPRSADEDEEDAATLDTIACNIGLLSKRQAHLADMQVQAIHVAKGYIDDRVNSAEQQARSHAEVLGYALTQVQADHHVLREHLSVYLQAIADSARQQINHVYEDLQSRHVMNLHSYDQRVQEIDRETQATKDAVKANDQALRRISANQSRIDVVECELKAAQTVIESQASTLVEYARRIDSLEERITSSNLLETRIFERVEKLLATAQLASASTAARLSGRMDRYDDRTARTTTRLDQLVGDAKKELKRMIEAEAKDMQSGLSNTESRLQAATVSRASFDEALSSMRASVSAQKDELLAVQTHVAQLVSAESRGVVPSVLAEHSDQIAAMKLELEQVERESMMMDESEANQNEAIRNIRATQEQQQTNIQQLLRLVHSPPPVATAIPVACEQHHSLAAKVERLMDLIVCQQASHHTMETAISHLTRVSQAPASSEPVIHEATSPVQAKIVQLSELIGQQQDAHLAMQIRIDKLDISIEDRVEAWFNHTQAVQGEV
jgi:hypothetical protein